MFGGKALGVRTTAVLGPADFEDTSAWQAYVEITTVVHDEQMGEDTK
jgi:hypothetical protein